MINNLWGRKIGMTQFFSAHDQNKLIPVTAIELGVWRVLQRKTVRYDGYDAVQIGCLRQKYAKVPFSLEWLKNKNQYFLFIKELNCSSDDIFEIGAEIDFDLLCQEGQSISVTGVTIGKGFQGAVKRYGFTGGRASHGDKLGRKPGSLSGLRTQGRVFKGKKMPGHMGNKQKTILGLKVIQYLKEDKVVLVSGPIPGKSGSFVMISKGQK